MKAATKGTAMAMSIHKPKYIVLRMVLITILVGIFIWSYSLFSQNYARVELSHKMVEALFQNKTDLAKKYAEQLGLAEGNLDRTESFLKDIKVENMKLKEKVKLLDELNNMEREIGRLREENSQIHRQMLEANYAATKKGEEKSQFNTIDEGKSLITKFKKKFRAVKDRIRVLKKKERAKKVAIQKEIDRKESLLGNNGYLIRGGQVMPMSIPDVTNLPEGVRVNVEFVK